MMVGPEKVRKCSACSQLLKERTYLSANTLGLELWSDGRWLAPFFPDLLRLVKCAHCGALVWVDELDLVGEIPLWEPARPVAGGNRLARLLRKIGLLPGRQEQALVPPREETSPFADARRYEEVSFDDYLAVLARGVSGADRMLYLRKRAWWAGNTRRRADDKKPPLTDAETANLHALLPLLDESDEYQRLMKAEALRQLGEFRAALALLARPLDDPLILAWAEAVRESASLENPFLRKVSLK